jgi:cytochrome c biogenesis protein CcmG/thiol:disulfide interchange protein DsbE
MSAKAPLLTLLALVVALCAPDQVRQAEAQSRGKNAPAFDLEVLQGEASGSLEVSRGKVVIVEFWATYCGWCKATHPKLAAFAAETPESVVVLGISAQKKSRLRRYLKRHDTGLTILHDPKAGVSRAYGATATPTLVVIDGQGKVRAWAQGGNKLKSILRTARSLLKP